MNKKFFLLDTNVVVDYYVGNPKVKKVFEDLLNKQKNNKCIIFIPNFCIGEAFNILANLCYYKNEISPEDFKKAKMKLISDVSRDYEYKRPQIYCHVELSRYHLLNAHLIYQPAWDFLKRSHEQGKYIKKDGSKKFPSTFDLLVIAQGIELAHTYSDNDFAILTSDEVVLELCKYFRTLTHEERISFIKLIEDSPDAFKNLSSFKYPRAIDARDYNTFCEFCR